MKENQVVGHFGFKDEKKIFRYKLSKSSQVNMDNEEQATMWLMPLTLIQFLVCGIRSIKGERSLNK
jgi:hypothetical protein